MSLKRIPAKLVERHMLVFSKRAVLWATMGAHDAAGHEGLLSSRRERGPVGGWRYVIGSREARRERPDALQTHGEADLRDRPVGGSEQGRGTLQAPGQQVRVRRLAEGPAELAAEVRSREARGPRQVLYAERFEIAAVGGILGAEQVAGRWDEGHRSSIAMALPRSAARHLQEGMGEAVFGAEPPDALRVELEPIASSEHGELWRREVGRSEPRCELIEEVLEASGRDDLEDPAGVIVGVPERVPLLARLEDEVTDLGIHRVLAE